MKITFRNPTQQYFPTPSHVTHNGVTFLWKHAHVLSYKCS